MGQYAVSPSLDFDRDATLDTDYKTATTSSYTTPNISVDPEFNPFKSSYNPPKKQSGNWESLYTDTNIVEESADIKAPELDFKEPSKQVHAIQINQKYILATIKSGAVLINQNLAHQRILCREF